MDTHAQGAQTQCLVFSFLSWAPTLSMCINSELYDHHIFLYLSIDGRFRVKRWAGRQLSFFFSITVFLPSVRSSIKEMTGRDLLHLLTLNTWSRLLLSFPLPLQNALALGNVRPSVYACVNGRTSILCLRAWEEERLGKVYARRRRKSRDTRSGYH